MRTSFIIFTIVLAVFQAKAGGTDLSETYCRTHGELRVEIPSVPQEGTLRMLLFRQEDGFPFKESHAAFVIEQPAIRGRGSQAAVFESIPYGEYAVFVYCDVNGNGSAQTGKLTSFKEISGYTKTARTRRTVPYYRQSVFEFSPELRRIEVEWSASDRDR